MKRWKNTLLATSLFIGVSAYSSAARAEVDFALREHLGHDWANECVTFPLTKAQLATARQGKALLDGDGQETTYQIVESSGQPSIGLQANLGPHQTLAYRFVDRAAAQPQTDLQIAETAATIHLGNALIGLEIRKTLLPGQGPIARLRLGPTTWTGSSAVAGGKPVTEYTVEVVAAGPVFAEATCRATFADQGTWTLRFRVERGEPAILVDESFDAPTGGVFQVVLGDNTFQPTHLLYRDSDVGNPNVTAGPVADYLLQPWLRWNNPRHGNWIALYTPSPVAIETPTPPDELGEDLVIEAVAKPTDPRHDLLVVGVLRPSLWRDPQWRGQAKQVAPHVKVTVADGLATLNLPVQGGCRLWLLGALDKTASESILTAKNRRVAPPPQQLLIKHGDFPLERVKKFVLEWQGDHHNHPRLYIRSQDVPALRRRMESNPVELRRWTSQQPIDKYYLDGPIREFIAGGDARLAQLMAAKGAEYLQTCVDGFLKQDERLTIGAAPHMQTLIVSALNLLDPVLSTVAVAPEQQRRLLAQIAFLGYVVNSPDYWSAERGYSSFANMASTVALFQTALGCMVPSHPQASEWANRGLDELRRQLLAWSDEDGGWLEAPHYAMVSYDFILGGFMMAANAGLGDYLYEDRMRKVAEWFATISTPRDSRTGGFRHHPPIGNTYHGEPTGVYGLLAGLWKERDPDFAARLQWMYQENGSLAGLGIGWSFPTMLGYKFLFDTHEVAAQPANFGSAWFRNTGVVLRNTMQTDRETYLHLIAGTNHDHYDYDSGSILIYGKGRVLADDWGYIGRHPDKWHSMLTSTAAAGGGKMQVEAFSSTPALDYVSGTKGAWQRQIAFVKDADPLGPNFFLLRDTHAADAPATWRLWLTTQTPLGLDQAAGAKTQATALASLVVGDDRGKNQTELDSLDAPAANPKGTAAPPITFHPQGATVSGAEDVDLDLFFHQADKLEFKTETATLKVSCGWRNGKQMPLGNTQTAILATLPGNGTVTALLYPRLKTEPPPKVAWHADGRIAEVQSAAGTDYVFLTTPTPFVSTPADEQFAIPNRQLSFQGRVGAVQIRHSSTILTLGLAGTVQAGNQKLTADTPTTQTKPR